MPGAPITYDAAVIQEFAQRLYRQAASIVVTSTIFCALAGGIVGGLGAALGGARSQAGTFLLIGLVVGGIFGFMRGRERAFKLRLEAQVALCQAQIEKNTSSQ